MGGSSKSKNRAHGASGNNGLKKRNCMWEMKEEGSVGTVLDISTQRDGIGRFDRKLSQP